MDGQAIERRFRELKGLRTQWEQHWQECADVILPRKSDIVTSNPMPGEKKTQKVFDSTAIEANELFASSLHGMLVSYTSPWFRIESQDDDVNDNPAANEWFQDVTTKMHAAIHNPTAGFTAALDEVFLDIGCFGTGVLEVEEGKTALLHFDSSPIEEEYLSENSDGMIDTSVKLFSWSARKISQKFPDADLPRDIRESLDKNPDKEYEILYAVLPRAEYDPSKKDKKNKPFAAIYVDRKTKIILEEGGFDEFPKMPARWRKLSREVYGRGPGMTALPDINMLNAMEKSLILAAEMILNPPLDVPHKGYVGKIRAYAGGVNYRKTLGNERIEVINTVGNYPIAEEKAQQKRDAIRRIFFNDQLQLAQGPDMTAFEVAQRVNEKLRLMSPMLGRIQSELMGPMLDRVFFIMLRNKAFKKPPAELRGNITRIRYLSQLAQAQAATEVDAIVRTLGVVVDMAGIDQGVLDNFDLNEAALTVARVYGYPADALRGEEAIEKLRGDRQAQQEAEQQKQDVERAADVASKQAVSRAAEQGARNA